MGMSQGGIIYINGYLFIFYVTDPVVLPHYGVFLEPFVSGAVAPGVIVSHRNRRNVVNPEWQNARKEKTIMTRTAKVIRNEKADEPRTFLMSRITFAICFFVSVGLIVGGFFVPPMGIIDGSCLTAVGELLLFPTLLYAYRAIELGLSVKFQKGETSIEISKQEDKDDNG